MNPLHFEKSFLIVLAVTISSSNSSVSGDIIGFGDFTAFEINVADSGSLPTTDSMSESIQLTNQGFLEARSIFHKVPQPVSQFEARFRYRAGNAAPLNGACFVIQNDPRGADAVGDNAINLGYSCPLSNPSACVINSVAVSIELDSLLPSKSGVYTNGSLGGGAQATSPVNLGSENEIEFLIRYNGGTEIEIEITDTVTLENITNVFQLGNSLPTIVAGNTAFVGFTASTSGGIRSNQFFSAFEFIGEYIDTDSDDDGVPDVIDDCPESATGAVVDQSGRPLGDVDSDCDVDLADFAVIANNFSGPN